ncbi:optic atrophy 3 protein-domain-containing protein [Pseudomassariella vexata]|uniref:Optic atrophy 3 protein-domain-containing protein n=1 Tax=Pseudomassariella vexata TaxID=1141098 RepID=A0A1Y2E4Y8_9PEZI|nr:optic atrophy 3 protein-domain-containing protein [Pseudomassariella vexata]ORY66424.1 optic atrophy 3 protein-domain-containing protein [Pseudomassariella vexata]
MVALPLFKLASLFLRHVSKYGANRIKLQAHEHPGFRHFAARYGQTIHQLNMRLSVSLLRNPEAERKAKEKAEAPTVKTAEQIQKDEEYKAKHGHTRDEARAKRPSTILNVWKRKFRPLPEEKAVDLFADVIGDAFILTVASTIILYEWWKSSQKPDHNLEKIKELNGKLEELQKEREEDRVRQESRVLALETALRGFKDPKTQQPLLPPAPTPPPAALSPA